MMERTSLVPIRNSFHSWRKNGTFWAGALKESERTPARHSGSNLHFRATRSCTAIIALGWQASPTWIDFLQRARSSSHRPSRLSGDRAARAGCWLWWDSVLTVADILDAAN